jgi:hypothetical protein
MPTSRKINTIQTEQIWNMKSKNGTADRQTQPYSEQIKLYSEKHYSNDFKNQILLTKLVWYSYTRLQIQQKFTRKTERQRYTRHLHSTWATPSMIYTKPNHPPKLREDSEGNLRR